MLIRWCTVVQAPLDALTGYATLNDLDQKASIADVNEGLKHKANKTVVSVVRGATVRKWRGGPVRVRMQVLTKRAARQVDKALSSKCDKAGLDALRVALGHKASKLCVCGVCHRACWRVDLTVNVNLATQLFALREVVEFVEAKCRDLEARVRSSLQDITVRRVLGCCWTATHLADA